MSTQQMFVELSEWFISVTQTVVHSGAGILGNNKGLKQTHVFAVTEEWAVPVHDYVEQNQEPSSKQDIYLSYQKNYDKSRLKGPTR